MTIVPIYSESANYKEWEFVADGETYTVVCHDTFWILLQLKGDEWVKIGNRDSVDEILHQHGLSLA